MSINDEIDKLESDFFRIVFDIKFNSDAKKWMGKIKIQRKDTNEIVKGGFRVFDEDKSLLEKKIIEKLGSIKSELIALGTPFEWKTKARLALLSYLKLQIKITKYGVFCDQVIAGKEDEKVFSEKYAGFWLEVIEDTLAITREIEMLSEKERIEMLILPKSVFLDPSDPWSLDEIDSRGQIIKFFLNPSEQEINTHKLQTKKLTDLFHQLGWDKE
jgi:hypothetical protein